MSPQINFFLILIFVQEYKPYKYIALLALPPEGSRETDKILRTNYILLPIAVSDSEISSSKTSDSYKLIRYFSNRIDSNRLWFM